MGGDIRTPVTDPEALGEQGIDAYPRLNPVTRGLGRGTKQPAVIVDNSTSAPITWPTGSSGGGIPIPMGTFVPPNGFAGLSQQTPAVQQLYRSKGRGGATRTRRRRSKKKAAGVSKTRVRRASGTRKSSVKKRMVKGSAAAKRWMAKIRKMRK